MLAQEAVKALILCEGILRLYNLQGVTKVAFKPP